MAVVLVVLPVLGCDESDIAKEKATKYFTVFIHVNKCRLTD